jgi:hypothetical protein
MEVVNPRHYGAGYQTNDEADDDGPDQTKH